MSESSAALPHHIGIILDGNRRWAKEKNLPTFEGHRQGAETLKTITYAAFDRGIKFVSAFVFSTENWNREKTEVTYLMRLTMSLIKRDLKELHCRGVRIVWLGSKDRVSEKLIKAFEDAEETTKNNTAGTLAFCFNYGGQLEIVDTVKKIIKSGIEAQDITSDVISGELYHPEVPPVDLLVRTSGEHRISNFMLWRSAYSELFFTDVLWPSFSTDDLDEALAHYASRQRRFGS
jgi:undecaprenyl diphosphate synthase